MKQRRPASLAVGALVLGGCAAGGSGHASHSGDQTVLFDALPEGTTVRVVPGPAEGLPTPFALRLSTRRDYRACFEKPGYESRCVEIQSKLTLAGKRNLDSSPQPVSAPGLLFDAATGRGYELVPDRVSVTLVPVPVTAPGK